MYLIYIDESGTSSFKEINVDYTLGAVIIDENQWHYIKNKIDTLKIQYFPNFKPDEIEIHAKEIFHKSKVFYKLKGDLNFKFLEDLFQEISNFELIIIVSHIFKKKLKEFQDRSHFRKNFTSEELAWIFLNDRVSKFLDKIMKCRIDQGMPSTFGLYLIDSIDKKYNSNRRRKIIKYFTSPMYQMGFFKPQSPYVIYDPVFVDSAYHIIIQIADLISYVIHRKYNSNRNTKIDIYCNRFFNMIIDKFDKKEDDPSQYISYGLKLYPWK